MWLLPVPNSPPSFIRGHQHWSSAHVNTSSAWDWTHERILGVFLFIGWVSLQSWRLICDVGKANIRGFHHSRIPDVRDYFVVCSDYIQYGLFNTFWSVLVCYSFCIKPNSLLLLSLSLRNLFWFVGPLLVVLVQMSVRILIGVENSLIIWKGWVC